MNKRNVFSIAMICLAASTASALAARSGTYAIAGAVENDKPVVNRATLCIIGAAPEGMTEWQMDVQLPAGGSFAVRAVSERAPMTSAAGPGRFDRYLFRDTRGKVTEYRNKRTGKALLPPFHFTESFLLNCRLATPIVDGFAAAGQYLGHIATLGGTADVDKPTAWTVDFDLVIDPEMRVGVLWPNKDDGTGQDKNQEYKYSPFTEKDYIETIEAGCNDFGAPPAEARAILQDRPVFFKMPPQFPEDFYRSNYAGTDHLTDEPAIRMVFMHLIPKEALVHPAQVADFLVDRVRGMYGREGAPYKLHNAVKSLTPMGTLDLRVDDIPCWETFYETAFYELAGGTAGIVHEGRYQRETEGWEPHALFGPNVEIKPEEMLRCHNAVMRGAARAFDKQWGVSIYGQCNPKLRQNALEVAYDMGARWFWFWTMDHDHHLPQAEKLRLMRSLRDYAKAHPRPDADRLRSAAGTAIALPWGYIVSWHEMWTVDRFQLNRLNSAGVPYRDVVTAALWEGILCAMRGEDFDFTVEHEGLDKLGYRRILRVTEDGVVHESPRRVTASRQSLAVTARVGPALPENTRKIEPAAYTMPGNPRYGSAPKIDGDLSDWKGHWFDLPNEQFKASGKWDGPNDLAARLSFGYDDDCLYVAADVTDDIHLQLREGNNIWENDGLQIGLDPLNTREEDSYVQGQHEIGLALGNDGRVRTWRWYGPGRRPQGPIEQAQVAIRRDDAGHHTFYEAAIPLEQLAPLLPTGGGMAGICVVVVDSDQRTQGAGMGGERECFIETSPGAMTNGKHPNRFGSLVFAPDSAPHKPAGARRARVHIVPRATALPSGAELCWLIEAWTGGSPMAMHAGIEVSCLSPLPPQTVRSSAEFECSKAKESREIAMRLEVPPGRYRLKLTVSSANGATSAQEDQLIFVYPKH